MYHCKIVECGVVDMTMIEVIGNKKYYSLGTGM
jgi:hypothetical protein